MEVGQYYSVRAFRAGYRHQFPDGSYLTIAPWNGYTGHIPLLNEFHEDEKFISTTLGAHAHIDWRFASDKLIKAVCSKHDDDLMQIVLLQPIVGGHASDELTIMANRIEMKLMLCKRPMPAPHPLLSDYTKQQLKYKYCTARMKGKCPHRGVDRASMIEVDGVLVCPAHGLRWHPKTGRNY